MLKNLSSPVRAGIVAEPHHYIYSSASNYQDGTGILPVMVTDLGITDFISLQVGKLDKLDTMQS